MNDQPPTIFGDGEQVRDFVYVDDVIEANLLALKSEATGIFNIASGRNTTINELAHFINTQKFGGKGHNWRFKYILGEILRVKGI